MKSKLPLTLLAALALAFCGFATAGDTPDKVPVLTESFSVDELQVDAFTAYTFNGSSDPWGYGVGATFFPNSGNLGVTADYLLSPDGSPDTFHTVNLGVTYRVPLTDTLDIYASGLVGYANMELEGPAALLNLEQLDYGSEVSYGGRAGVRWQCPVNSVAVFSDFGRMWDGFDSNVARAGFSLGF